MQALQGAKLRLGGRLGRQQKQQCTAAAAAPPGDMKTALVTGANTGIGLETSKALARQGYAVVLACRDLAKGQAARDAIKAEVPGARAEAVPLDLADLASVRGFAQKALANPKAQTLDVLVNNAGVMACPPLRTKDGFELQLGVNHLGHFLLTTLLLPLLTHPDRPSRIVNVSSSAHQFGAMNFDDLQSTRGYQAWRAYGQSKLANVLFTYELARRLPPGANCTVNALHPGVVNTELQRYLVPKDPPFWQLPFLQAARVFLKTPEQGARTSVFLASSPEVAGITGKYFANCKAAASSKASHDAAAAARLWDVSRELTGADVSL